MIYIDIISASFGMSLALSARMVAKQKFGITLKDKGLKYFARVIQLIDSFPRYLALQLLSKKLISSTLDLTQEIIRLDDSEQEALLAIVACLRQNEIILQAIELSRKSHSALVQGLIIETNELLVIAEAAQRN